MKHGQILSFISPYSVELNLQYFNINCDKTRYLLGQCHYLDFVGAFLVVFLFLCVLQR